MVIRRQIYGDKTTDLWLQDDNFMVIRRLILFRVVLYGIICFYKAKCNSNE